MNRRLELHNSLAPLTFLSRIFGVFPVAITRDGRAVVSYLAVVYGMVVSVGFGAFELRYSSYKATHNNFILLIVTMTYPLVASTLCFIYVCRGSRIAKALDEIYAIYDILPPKNTFLILIAEIVGFNLLNAIWYGYTLYNRLSKFSSFENVFHRFAEDFAIFAIFLINLQFSKVLLFVYKLFKALNKKLKSLKPISILERPKPDSDVLGLITKFNQVSSCCNLVTRCFGAASAGTAMYTLCSLVLVFYDVIIYGWDYVPTNATVIAGVVWQQWMVLYACEKVLGQVILIF